MNAKELTSLYYLLDNKMQDAEREIEFLKEYIEKLELRLNDLIIDVRQKER